MADCTREDCGHPETSHGDRAVVACHGNPTAVPNEFTWRQPACRCVGWTQTPGKPAGER